MSGSEAPVVHLGVRIGTGQPWTYTRSGSVRVDDIASANGVRRKRAAGGLGAAADLSASRGARAGGRRPARRRPRGEAEARTPGSPHSRRFARAPAVPLRGTGTGETHGGSACRRG